MARIIITGGLGYIGTELTKLYFNDSNNEVSVIDNSFFSQRVQNLIDAGINYHNVSILDVDKLEPLLHEADIVYHLAGITDVPQVESNSSEEKNLKIHEVGIVGTNNIIKLTNKNSKIIFPSTHVVFEGLNKITKEITEEEPVSANLVYSKVKVQNENDLKNSDLNFTILRLGSVHGLSDDSTRLNIMPNLFSKLSSQKKELRLYGGGVQLKSLVSVKDVARCLKFSGENKKTDRQMYHCTSEHFTVKEVAEICKNKVPELVIKSSSEDIPNLGYSLSNKKLLDIGFEFKISLSTSIGKMISAWSN
tara:strand:- start:2341 stop:3258 length:918 start_codon:yes stop_codon:yes gene_type:complete